MVSRSHMISSTIRQKLAQTFIQFLILCHRIVNDFMHRIEPNLIYMFLTIDRILDLFHPRRKCSDSDFSPIFVVLLYSICSDNLHTVKQKNFKQFTYKRITKRKRFYKNLQTIKKFTV